MAAMEQRRLNNMCTTINGEADKYVTNVNQEVKNFLEAFNTNWVSTSAQNLATEIQTCLESLATNVTNVFAAKDADIKQAVIEFNMVEEENISYSGFSFSKPNTTLTLNSSLPNGKVGVADNADLNSINTPMQTLVSKVESVLDGVVQAVKSADAFNEREVETLTTSVTQIKNKFVTEMEELRSSLSSRMSGEISTRSQLDSSIISGLSS